MTGTTARRRTVHHCPHPTHPPPDQPLRVMLDLGAVPTAPGCARAWTRQILWEWRLAGLSDTTDLIGRHPGAITIIGVQHALLRRAGARVPPP